MLSPAIHGTHLSFPTIAPKLRGMERLFVLSFDRLRGSLFVLSPEEISLIDSYHALPGQPLTGHLQGMESKVFEALKNLRPTLSLAAKPGLRQRFEAVSRIPSEESLSLDRCFSPSEKALLHRCMMALLRLRQPIAADQRARKYAH